MGFEKLRLLIAAGSWLAAGALAASAGDSARTWVGAVLLLILGLLVGAPLTRRRAPPTPIADIAPTADTRLLAVLQAQLEHLPVAAWVLSDAQQLRPLSNRARRLAAPGAVRDHAVLNQLLRSSERSGALVLETERGSERWQLQRQALALDGEQQTLLVLMPLENELESESLQAWQQLVQILTHEIMNSLTPIRSLSQTALSLFGEPGSEADLRSALDAIARRAESLSGFVGKYRQVSRLPEPTLAPVDLQPMFKRLQQAIAPAWSARAGEASFDLASPSLQLLADEGQLEQALLALIHNAEQATLEQDAPRLWVQARTGRGGRLQISVRDNGPGVPAGLERQIFLPFFSAREGGQGIGLSLVRQLMFGMGGRVRHIRPLEGGASFVLIF
jgi:C4-dicarboxylate-specific signal transduction histidine kinase